MEPKTELVRNALAEQRRKELEFVDRTLGMQWINNRMEDGRMNRCLALIKREAATEKDYHERTDHAAIVNERAEKEIKLGLEIAKVEREQNVAYLRRHYLRQEDHELQNLMRKLQAGYVCRDLQQQIRNNEYRRLQEKAEENQAKIELSKALYSDQEYQLFEEQKKIEHIGKYGQELRQQLVSKQIERQCQYEDTLIEKKMLDEVLRTISDEDKREIEQKRALIEKTRKEMVTFKQAQDAWAAKQKQIILLEEKEIERQQKALSDRNAAIVAERLRIQKAKNEITEKIAAEVLANEYAKQERDGLIKLLQEQERLEADIQDDRAARDNLNRIKRETKEALTEQMRIKKEQQEQEKMSNANYLKEVREKMAREEAAEREKERLVSEKNRRHCAELLKQAEQQRRERLEAKRADSLRAAAVNQYLDQWDKETAQERAKIVKEHVPNLLGYLQAGTITKGDLPMVREGASQNPLLADMNIDALEQARRPKRFPKCNAQCMIIRDY